tara:strand:+ start:291 stop:1025 length:735 start_codon:yes stop_codon:yes gene_type:complete
MYNYTKILNVNSIYKKYNDLQVLKKVTFSVKPRELVIILGPNGAGKSTLFSIISGLIIPDKGDCIIAGSNIEEEPVKALKSLGIVFQQPTIDMELTIIENLMFHASLQGLKSKFIKDVIENELINFDLYKKLNNKVKNLSGGERRKVELIRSILHKPKMLLMDEPTVGLDPSSRKELLTKITKLKEKEKLSVLWATHLVDEAEKADKIIILNKGQVIEMGKPSALKKRTNSKSLNKAFFKIIGK